MATKTQEAQTDTKQRKSSGVLQTVGRDVKPFQAFFTKFNNDWSMNLAAALAYNLLFAIFPIVIAVLSILGIILGGLAPDAQQQLIQQIEGVFPSAVSSGVVDAIVHKLPQSSSILGILAILVAIFGGSRLFVLIEGCFGIIYHVRPRPFLRQNLMAIGMLLLFIVLVPIMVVASLGPTFVFTILKSTPLYNLPGSSFIFGWGGILGGLLASWLLFLAIFIIVPNQKITFRNSWLGALVAAVALEIYLALFPFYATRFLSGYAGQVGFAIILLSFFYYFAIILFLGAEVNAFFAEKVKATPVDLVTIVHDYTSHLPQDPQQKQEEAAASHKEVPTGSQTKQAGNGAASTDTAPHVQPQEPREVSSHADLPAPAHGEQGPKAKKPRSRGRITTVIEAAAGTALAFLIELVQLRRRRGK
jgi:membrane protein